MLTSPRLAVTLLLLAAPAAAQILPLRAWPAATYPNVGATGDLDGDGLADLATGGADLALLLRDPAGGFVAPLLLPIPGSAYFVTLGHVDGGGTLDLVCTNGEASPIVSLRLGDGAGGFGPAVDVAVPAGPAGLALGDFDTDGDDDVAVSSNQTDMVSILLSNGAGGLALSSSVATGDWPTDVRAGDLDEDGNLDLATPIYKSARVQLLTGNGAGAFTVSSLPAPASPFELLLADMDVDGHLDLLLSPAGPVAMAMGHGDGSFEPWTDLPFDSTRLHVADVDGNGLPDIVGFASGLYDTVDVQLGQPGGAYVPTPQFETGSYSGGGLTTLDTNDDGLPDLVVGTMGDDTVGVARGRGFGEFEHVETMEFKADPQDMVTGDFDHDGDNDLAVVSAGFGGGGGVTTLRNQHAGQFKQESDIGFGLQYDIETGDVDANGDLDLVSTGYSTGIHVQLGDGTLDYGWSPALGFGLQEQDSAVGDLDGDGDDDIATCFGIDAAGRVAVYWSDGAGGFTGPFPKQVGLTPSRVDVADLNVDGQLDLVVDASYNSVIIGVLLHGHAFADPVLTYTYAGGFVVGDLDGDGLPETVSVTDTLFMGDPTFVVHESDGSGGFGPAKLFDAGAGGGPAFLVDMNGDSALDIVTVGFLNGLMGLTLTDGAGGLVSQQQHTTNQTGDAMTLGDVTGDGYPDVLLAYGYGFGSSTAQLSLLASIGPEQPWKHLGQGKAGVLGIPMLVAHGTLQPGEPLTLELRGAAPSSATTLVIGLSPLFASFKGGVLVPQPNLLLSGLVTNAQGGLLLGGDWPDGVPSGTQTWYQFWIADPAASAGYSASNGATAAAP